MTPALLAALSLAAAAQPAPPGYAAPALSTGAVAAEAADAATLGLSTSAPVLPLEDAVAAAVARRLTYLSAVEDVRSAQGSLRTQDGAYDPTVVLSFSNAGQLARTVVAPGVLPTPTDSRNPALEGKISQALPTGGALVYDVKDNGTDTIPFPTLHQAAATITLTHPLLRGAGPAAAYAAVDAAFAALKGSEAAALRALEQAVADAENAYWTLMQAEGQEEAARLSMIAGDKLVERNKELEKRKLIAAYDVLAAEAGAGQRRAAFIEAARQRRDAVDGLVFTVFGEEAARRFKADAYDLRTTTEAPPVPPLPATADAEEAALQTREDLIAQRYGLRQADISLAQLKRDVLPDLSGSATYGGNGNYQTGETSARWDAVKRAMLWEDPTWSLGLTLTFPVLLRADRGRYLSGLAAREKQRLAVVTTENQVRLDVRSALRAVRFEERRWKETELVADLYQRQLEGERRRLDLGLSDSYRLLQVEHDATQARLDRESARLALSQALTGYRLAAGTIADVYRKSP